MNTKSTRFWIVVALAWAAIIYIGTSLPQFSGPKTQAIFGHFDYIVRIGGHLGEFFVLAFVLYGLAMSFRLYNWKSVLFVLGICLFLAFLDEYHQIFVAGRSYKLLDVGKDLIGASLALLAVKLPHISKKVFHVRPRYRRVIYYA